MISLTVFPRIIAVPGLIASLSFQILRASLLDFIPDSATAWSSRDGALDLGLVQDH